VSSRVLVAVRVEVPPERAFDAFVGEIGTWWRPNGLFRTGPRQPGTLAFEGGAEGELVEIAADGSRYPIGRIRHWQRPERLVFSWHQPDFPDDLDTEVEVRFEASPGGTRVTVEHRGFARVPADSAARHGFPDSALLERLAEWWQALLERYAVLVSKNS
jgi:uncharacterized protein YndB with AHSA1/START domain